VVARSTAVRLLGGGRSAAAREHAPLRTHIVQRDDQPRVVEIGHHPGRDADVVESVNVISGRGAGVDTVSTGSGQKVVGRDRFDAA
jgi:hypothetical protein